MESEKKKMIFGERKVQVVSGCVEVVQGIHRWSCSVIVSVGEHI
jgi:hypothetical protein